MLRDRVGHSVSVKYQGKGQLLEWRVDPLKLFLVSADFVNGIAERTMPGQGAVAEKTLINEICQAAATSTAWEGDKNGWWIFILEGSCVSLGDTKLKF